MTSRITKPERTLPAAVAWRRALVLSVLVLAFGGAVFATQQIELLLIRDPHFALPAPLEYGDESPGIQLTGIRFASRPELLRVFRPDLGRSLYLLPLEQRRRQLLRVPWVQDASILRTWPNRITVNIVERRPVAFLRTWSESISRWYWIDRDGIVLQPPAGVTLDLPVISGVRLQESQPMRASRVHRMLRLVEDLGALQSKVSVIDTADLDNLKVSLRVDRRSAILLLGDRNFRARLSNFLDHYGEIRRRLPEACVFDLQLDGRVFSVPDPCIVNGGPPGANSLEERRSGQ